MTAPITNLTPAESLAVCQRLLTGSTAGDEASDGPGERCIAASDLLDMADQEEARCERAMWGGAA